MEYFEHHDEKASRRRRQQQQQRSRNENENDDDEDCDVEIVGEMTPPDCNSHQELLEEDENANNNRCLEENYDEDDDGNYDLDDDIDGDL